MPNPRPRSQTITEEYEEEPRRFHNLEPLLAAATRAETAATNQALHQALASGACVWGYRKHRMVKTVKNAPGQDAERVCSRCGYGPKKAPSTHGTSGGSELTDQAIERLTAEAERGYDLDRLTARERAVKLREMAAIERNEAAEIESDRDISPGRAQSARLARQLAKDLELAADRLDPDQGTATSLLAGSILLVSYAHVR